MNFPAIWLAGFKKGVSACICAFMAKGLILAFKHPVPMAGKIHVIFPTLGITFSRHWKKLSQFFQSLETLRPSAPICGLVFPTIGKAGGTPAVRFPKKKPRWEAGQFQQDRKPKAYSLKPSTQ
jgi:hypothetical protein